MNKNSITQILNGAVSVGTQVTIKGWVRSRRTSKAGISFVALHDGSCFDAIQIVVPQELENYQDEVLHLSAGCAIEAHGEFCLLYTSPSPRDQRGSRMPSSA